MKLLRLLDVRPEERRRVRGMFALLALVIATSYVLKPVRSALFLSEFGAERLPYVYLLVAVVLGLVGSAFAKLSPRADIGKLLTNATFIFASNLVFFWILTVLDWRFTGFAFYVWVSLFTALMPSLFWLLANYVFYSNEGRRLFPIVMAGGLLGSIGGGALTSLLVPVIGTPGLLLSAAAMLGVVALLVRWNVSHERDRISERRFELARKARGPAAAEPATPFALVRRSRYLTLVALLIGVTSLVSTLVDYQFSVVVEANFETRDQMTEFFGLFFAAINVIAFTLQLVGVGRLLGRFGVSGGLILLPAALLLTSGSFLAVPLLLTAAFVKAADDGLSNSVNRASLEVLYLPVPLTVKTRLKAWLDMFVERASRGIAGITILALGSGLALSREELGVVIIVLIVPWMGLIFLLKGEYVRAFHDSIARREVSDPSATMNDPASLSVVRQILSGNDRREILYALELVSGTREPKILEQAMALTSHPDAGVRAAAYRALRGAEVPLALEPEHLDERIVCESPTVAAEALALYLDIDPDGGHEALERLVASADVERLQAVMECLDGSGGVLSLDLLRRIARENASSNEARARRLAASAMAFLSDATELGELGLLKLLEDPDIEVARAAAKSAGTLQPVEALPLLIEQLGRPTVRRASRAALTSYGPDVLDELVAQLHDESRRFSVRLALPRVIGALDDQSAVDALLEFLPANDHRLHYQAIRGLSELHAGNVSLKFPKATIEALIEHEREWLDSLVRHGAALASEELSAAGASLGLLRTVISERFEFTRERLFLLLGIAYPDEAMAGVYGRIERGSPATRGVALEYLANVLSPTHRAALVPLVETTDLLALERQTRGGPPGGSRLRASVVELALSQDAWVAACAITVLGELGLFPDEAKVESMLHHPSPLVAEAAARALGRDSAAPA